MSSEETGRSKRTEFIPSNLNEALGLSMSIGTFGASIWLTVSYEHYAAGLFGTLVAVFFGAIYWEERNDGT